MVTKELAAAWKAQLLEQGYRPVSVNAMLAAVNKLLVCIGREDCKVRYLKLQRQMFRKSERELTRAECVVLAGLPNAPSVYAANGELARRRALVVVERMERAKKLTHTQALELRDEVSALPLW